MDQQQEEEQPPNEDLTLQTQRRQYENAQMDRRQYRLERRRTQFRNASRRRRMRMSDEQRQECLQQRRKRYHDRHAPMSDVPKEIDQEDVQRSDHCVQTQTKLLQIHKELPARIRLSRIRELARHTTNRLNMIQQKHGRNGDGDDSPNQVNHQVNQITLWMSHRQQLPCQMNVQQTSNLDVHVVDSLCNNPGVDQHTQFQREGVREGNENNIAIHEAEVNTTMSQQSHRRTEDGYASPNQSEQVNQKRVRLNHIRQLARQVNSPQTADLTNLVINGLHSNTELDQQIQIQRSLDIEDKYHALSKSGVTQRSHRRFKGTLQRCIMGSEEVDTSTKTQKSTSAQPPPSSPATVYPDWASFQAYYHSSGTTPIPPPGFFHFSLASSPQGHPYMWAPQIIPPYGTPPPYITMYPHGGLYPHPSIPPGGHPYSPYAMPSSYGTAEASVAVATGELDGKLIEGKERSPLKGSKGSLGSLNMLTSKDNAVGKASDTSANGVSSQSGDSGNEGSSEGSDANSQNGSQQKQRGEHCSGDEEAQNGSIAGSTSSEITQALPTPAVLSHSMSMAIPPGGISGPTTNLNIGMDYWRGSTFSPIPTLRGNFPALPSAAVVVPSSLAGSRDGVPSDLWLQDERELKRQRRKQSNRESARRSRLRKQAECEELAQHVGTLKEENDSLRDELGHIRKECEKLALENSFLTERLQKHKGKD